MQGQVASGTVAARGGAKGAAVVGPSTWMGRLLNAFVSPAAGAQRGARKRGLAQQRTAAGRTVARGKAGRTVSHCANQTLRAGSKDELAAGSSYESAMNAVSQLTVLVQQPLDATAWFEITQQLVEQLRLSAGEREHVVRRLQTAERFQKYREFGAARHELQLVSRCLMQHECLTQSQLQQPNSANPLIN